MKHEKIAVDTIHIIPFLSSSEEVHIKSDSNGKDVETKEEVRRHSPHHRRLHLKEAFLHTFGLIDPSFDFSKIRYLQSKNIVNCK